MHFGDEKPETGAFNGLFNMRSMLSFSVSLLCKHLLKSEHLGIMQNKSLGEETTFSLHVLISPPMKGMPDESFTFQKRKNTPWWNLGNILGRASVPLTTYHRLLAFDLSLQCQQNMSLQQEFSCSYLFLHSFPSSSLSKKRPFNMTAVLFYTCSMQKNLRSTTIHLGHN